MTAENPLLCTLCTCVLLSCFQRGAYWVCPMGYDLFFVYSGRNLDDDLAAMKREGYEGWEMVLYSYGLAMFVSAAVRLEHFLNA